MAQEWLFLSMHHTTQGNPSQDKNTQVPSLLQFSKLGSCRSLHETKAFQNLVAMPPFNLGMEDEKLMCQFGVVLITDNYRL